MNKSQKQAKQNKEQAKLTIEQTKLHTYIYILDMLPRKYITVHNFGSMDSRQIG